MIAPSPCVRAAATVELDARALASIRRLLDRAFWPDFGDDDWHHALGGTHVIASAGREIVAHAALVERTIHVAGRPLQAGYVEAVATAPEHQGRGLGSLVMEHVGTLLDSRAQLGVLSTGRTDFYRRLGWRAWLGPSSVRRGGTEVRTPDDDGGIMVRTHPAVPVDDLSAPISCDDRPGDCW